MKKSLKINGKLVKRAKIDGALYYESAPWYSEYGVLADYVVSNGIDNWIDTYISTQQDLIIEMGVTYLKPGTEQSGFGAYDLNNVVIEAGSFTSGGNAFYAYDDDRTWDVRAFDVEFNKHYNLKYNFQNGLQIVYIDDVEVHRTTNTSGALVGLTMVLFCRNYGTASSNVRQNHMNAKWTHFKVSKSDGTVLADYKPFYISKKPMTDWKEREHLVGKYTMIDMVRKSATPLYGEDMEGSYTPWWTMYGSATPFVISNGTNNYIDTGISIQNDLNIETDLEYLNIDGTSEHLFGGVNGEEDARRIVEMGFINGGKLTYAYGQSWTNTTYSPEQDTPYKLRTEFTDGSQIMYVNGVEEYRTTTTTDINQVISMYLFSRNEFGSPSTNMATVKMKSFNISKPTSEVLLDLVPIYLDKQEMMDANGRVYPIGSFVLVDNITEKTTNLYGDALKGYVHWWQEYGALAEYLESDGSQYIETDYKYNTADTIETGILINNKEDWNSDIYTVFGENNQYLYDSKFGLTFKNGLNAVAGVIINYPNNQSFGSTSDNTFGGLLGEKMDIKLGKNVYTPNTNNIIHTFEDGVVTEAGKNIRILNGYVDTYNPVAGRIYYFKVDGKIDLIPIQVTKTFIDLKGVTHNVGDWIMVNNLTNKDVPTHYGKFSGELSFYRDIEGITFESDKTYPYMEIGKWSDYNVILTTFTSNDTSNADIFFGREANKGIVGYSDTNNMIINTNITTDSYTITPNLTNLEKGDGTQKVLRIMYNSTNENPMTFGAYSNSQYTKAKIIKGMRLGNTDTGLDMTLNTVVLEQDYQGYLKGAVGLLDKNTKIFYGSNDPNYNFKEYIPTTYIEYLTVGGENYITSEGEVYMVKQ